MKRDSNEETLGDAIDRLMKVYRLDGKLREAKLIEGWEKLLGPMIARQTREIFIKDKILHVRLNSSVLREELSFAKSKLVHRLNEEAGGEVITDVLLK